MIARLVMFDETRRERPLCEYTVGVQKQLPDAIQQKRWRITVNIGLVTCMKAATSPEELMKKADQLIQLVKKSGKNNVAHAIVS